MTERISAQLTKAVATWVRPIGEQIAAAFAANPELLAAIERLLDQLPENWPRRGVELERVTEVIQRDGLPLVWVPPAEIVAAVLAAPHRAARVAVLLDHADELVRDCRRVLAQVHTERLRTQLPLAPRVLDAFEAGHHEAAQALAVVVTDAVIASWLPGKYEAVAQAVNFDPKEVPIDWVGLQAAVAPLANFKARYFAGHGDRPDALNRQVTVHYADAEHFDRGNALVGCLLMTSVLRALQEFEERAAA